MTLYEIYPKIMENPIFKNSSLESINKYINPNTFTVHHFEPQDTIYSQNSENLCVGVLTSGIASVFSDSGNMNFVLRTLSDGDMFGVANLYAEENPFPSIISAKTQVECIFISGEAFKAFLESDPNTLRTYLKLLNNKIIYLNHKITVFTAGSAEKKLAVFLAENQIGGSVLLSCSMSDLSDILGLGRASLYRALDKLTELGLILRQSKEIRIPDIEKLKKFFS